MNAVLVRQHVFFVFVLVSCHCGSVYAQPYCQRRYERRAPLRWRAGHFSTGQ